MISRTNVADYLITSPNTYSGYWNWEIFSNETSLLAEFKRIIAFEIEPGEKPITSIKCIFEEDLAAALDLFEKYCASKGRVPFEIVLRYAKNDLSVIHTLCRAYVTDWSHDNLPLRMVGCQMDITAYSSGKFDTGILYQQHKLIIDGINAGIWDWNIRSGITWWSDKLYTFLGYSPNEIKPSYESLFNKMLHPDDRKMMSDLLAIHLLNSKAFITDIRLQCKDGHYHWFEISGKSKLDNKGMPVRLVGAIMDMDKRKRLRSELERYQFLINESSVLIKAGSWEINFTENTVVWSSAMIDIHETAKGFQPNAENIYGFLQEKDQATLKMLLTRLSLHGDSFDNEFESVTAKGNKKWIRMIGKSVINNYGKIVMLRGITQDIHEQKLKDEQIKHSLNVITDKNKRLSNFAQIVSHNLRAHAANIDTILSLIDINTDAEQKKELLNYLGKISSNLNLTIDHLSDLIKINNSTDMPRSAINFNEVYKSVLDVLRPTILETKTIVKHELEEYTNIDYVPAYLESILLNLISNAIKYRKPDIPPQITVRTYLQDGRKCLSVTDNGLGIDLNKYKSKLFGLYNTFHANADARGIGLFITRSQIESLGGTIAVLSEPGNGSTFYIQF